MGLFAKRTSDQSAVVLEICVTFLGCFCTKCRLFLNKKCLKLVKNGQSEEGDCSGLNVFFSI